MNALRDYLATRRTIPANQLAEPGPDASTLDAMLTLAMRVPDHGKLAPWRFIAFTGDSRAIAGERIAAIAQKAENAVDLDVERTRFTRAPVVVAVVSTAAPHVKIPEWEQLMSAGAVCLNLLHAAAAYGFSAQWLSEWIAYDDDAKAALGIAKDETVAGFVHIGTPQTPPTERDRPVLAQRLTHFGAA